MPRISSCAPLRLMCRFKLHKVSKTGWAAFSVFHFFVSLLPLATAPDRTSSSLSKLNFFYFLHLNPWGDLGDSSAPFILFCLHCFRIWKVFLAGSFVLTAERSVQSQPGFYPARRDGICSRTESICRRVLILPRHYGLKLKGVLSSSLAQ